MSENKYETRVREIAEEMAKELFPYSYGTKHLGEVDYKCHEEKVKHFLPAARIAVKHMATIAADAWEAGRYAWWSENGELEEGEEAYSTLNEYRIDSGLIPTPERKEAGEV